MKFSRTGCLGEFNFMYQSVPSLAIPPPRATPGDSHVLTARGVGFLPNFLCPGRRGFELENFSTVLKEKCRNLQICVKETGGSLKAGVFVLFHTIFFAKTVDVYCIFNNIDHFRSFRSF